MAKILKLQQKLLCLYQCEWIIVENNPERYSFLNKTPHEGVNEFVHYINNHGVLEFALAVIKNENSYIATITESLSLIYKILDVTYNQNLSENYYALFFQDIGGWDELDRLIDHKNGEVREKAIQLVHRFYEFDVTDIPIIGNADQSEEEMRS